MASRITDEARLKLFSQTIRTLVKNSIIRPHTLTIVDDASSSDFGEAMIDIMKEADPRECLHITYSRNYTQAGIGASKNKGATTYPPTKRALDSILMFLDDDFYLLPEWDMRLMRGLKKSMRKQLGGWSHPFNALTSPCRVEGTEDWIMDVDAVAGGCQVMLWEDWDAFGPFPDNATGVGQSEDFALSQKVVKAGFRVGCLYPFVGIHCGLTNSEGQEAVGYGEMKELAIKQAKTVFGEGVLLV